MKQDNGKPKKRNWFVMLGGIAGIVTICGLLIATLQLWQSLADSKSQEQAQATLIAISERQLSAQQTLVALQQDSSSPQQIADIKSTIAALENERLFAQATLTPGFIAQTITTEPTIAFSPTAILTSTSIPTLTEMRTPTTTPLPSNTPTPKATNTPPFNLIFDDNFDSGIRPEWKVLGGEPIVTNGRLGSSEKSLVLEFADNLPNESSIEFDYWLATCCNTHITMIFDESFRYTLDAFWTKWEVFKDNSWIEIAKGDGVGAQGNIRFVVSDNKYVVFVNGNKYYEIIYGSPLSRGIFQMVFSNDITFIDNLKITTPQ